MISTDFNSLKWQVKPNIRSSFKQFGKPYQGMISCTACYMYFICDANETFKNGERVNMWILQNMRS